MEDPPKPSADREKGYGDEARAIKGVQSAFD